MSAKDKKLDVFSYF